MANIVPSPHQGLPAWPPVALAPMAGITDLPFRRLVARFGAGWVTSEMIASGELLAARPGTREKAELGLGEGAVQLAGRDPGLMARAASYLESQGAQVIDINMGCPAKKVTQGLCGAALMCDPDLALRVIESVVRAVSVPVTLKMRLGWDDSRRNAPDIARMAESAGVRMIAVHGRTRAQFYDGRADWGAIRAVKDAVAVPVIANGDIADPASARAALAASGADGVMVGRGVRGRPWTLAVIAAAIYGLPAPEVPQGSALSDMIAGHYEDMLAFYGSTLGLRVARKHLGWYMDAAGTPTALRQAVLTAGDPAAVLRLIPDAMGAAAEVAA